MINHENVDWMFLNVRYQIINLTFLGYTWAVISLIFMLLYLISFFLFEEFIVRFKQKNYADLIIYNKLQIIILTVYF